MTAGRECGWKYRLDIQAGYTGWKYRPLEREMLRGDDVKYTHIYSYMKGSNTDEAIGQLRESLEGCIVSLVHFDYLLIYMKQMISEQACHKVDYVCLQAGYLRKFSH